MIKTIVVDDQIQSRKYLIKLLNTISEIEVIAEAGSADQGIDLIKKLAPELVFLDVEMPGKTGIEMLQEMTIIDFEVIFATGYSDYAISAIKNNALDYLLKPVQLDELKEAIQKFKERKEEGSYLSNISLLENSSSKNILLSLSKGYKLVSINNIVYCESSGRYTIFHFHKTNSITVAQNLGSFESHLTENGFVRIHDSYMINLLYFDIYNREREKHGEVCLITGDRIKVSRTRKSVLLSTLKKFKIGI
jgi:two-component system LytT family response regulator